MKIGIFTYDFPHKKTQEGVLNLLMNNYEIQAIFSAPSVKLKFYQSKLRISEKNISYVEPYRIARHFNIPFHTTGHNSKECLHFIKSYELDLGIILGARIISEEVIEAFRIGILNIHPGLLPENRGLDSIKWAIIRNIKQGVTSHLIDKNIDRGLLIEKRTISVYEDDSILDIWLRNMSAQQESLIASLRLIQNNTKFIELEKGDYFRSVPKNIEVNLQNLFSEYKKTYSTL